MESLTSCPEFVNRIIDIYALGERAPFLEASIEDGAEVKIDDIVEVIDSNTDGSFDAVDKFASVETNANAFVSCGDHKYVIKFKAYGIPGSVVSYGGGQVVLKYDAPKMSAGWIERALAHVNDEVFTFRHLAPYLPLVSYAGRLINFVFLDKGDENAEFSHYSASDFLHFAHKYPSWVDKVQGWRSFKKDPEHALSLYLSLNAANAGWFSLVDDFNMGKPKEFVREMYLKVMKRRSKFSLKEVFERAAAAELL